MTLWGKKDEELPEELKGKTQEQIIADIKRVAALDAEKVDLTSRLTAADAKVTDLSNELSPLKQKVADLEANQKPPIKADDNEPTSWFADPDKAFNERAAGLTNVTLRSAMMTAKMVATNSLQGQRNKSLEVSEMSIFRKYETEIAQMVNAMAPIAQTDPNSWLMAFNLVKGNHFDDLVKASREDTDFFGELPTGQQSISRDNVDPDPKDWSGRDKAIAAQYNVKGDLDQLCKNLGITKERYLARRKEMAVVSDIG